MKKIYILDEVKEFVPNHCLVNYPPRNTNRGYSIEQDFLDFLKTSEIRTENINEADYFYLPIFWQRHCYNNGYYMNPNSLISITNYLNSLDIKQNTFTVSCIDGGPLGSRDRIPMLNNTIIYSACPCNSEVLSKNIRLAPLITSEHIITNPSKKYLANFIGRINTHEYRNRMCNCLNLKDILIIDGYRGNYSQVIEESLVSLCPRGCGLSSFRFFESMQLGTAPLLIADYDVRPFKEYIEWDKCSLFCKTPEEINNIINNYSSDELIEMGKNAKEVYYDKLNYKKWCNLVINDLNKIDN